MPKYPFVEISPTAVSGKCRVCLWLDYDDPETIYKDVVNLSAIKDVLQPVLQDYPGIRIKATGLKDNGYLHIFRVRYDKEAVSAFARTSDECSNPFVNRKAYAISNPNHTVGFDSIEL
jgi:hypothetical protein